MVMPCNELHSKHFSFTGFLFTILGLCEWNVPEGGLFLWLKAFGIGDTWDMLMERGLKKNVMLVPGRAFATRKGKTRQRMIWKFKMSCLFEL
jgi:DNA-binding transcriptional MocR family regulator